jgi:hypothetical protein
MVTLYKVVERNSWYCRTQGTPGCGCIVRKATSMTPEIRCVKHIHEFITDEGSGVVHVGFTPAGMSLDEFERLYDEAQTEEYWRGAKEVI